MLLNFTVRRWLTLAPAPAVIGVLFVGGLALAAQSLGYFAPAGENDLTLRHYVSLGDDREIYVSLCLLAVARRDKVNSLCF